MLIYYKNLIGGKDMDSNKLFLLIVFFVIVLLIILAIR